MDDEWVDDFDEDDDESDVPADEFLDELDRDLSAADFLLSLVVAAANSYRFHSALRPYPPVKERKGVEVTEEEHDRLRRLLEKIPPLQSVLADDELKEEGVLNFLGIVELMDILNWTIKPENFKLHTLNAKKGFAKVKELTGQKMETKAPTHVFELCWKGEEEEKWKQRKGSAQTIFAYHGSRLENFHSILRLGLHQHLNKTSLFGEGTYLSSELSVCFNYSPTGSAWSESMLGDALSCVAVCEVIPGEGVRCGSRAKDGLPEKYFVVANNDKLRVKYVLVYSSSSKGKARCRCNGLVAYFGSRGESVGGGSGGVYRPMSVFGPIIHWISRNRFTMLMVLYIVVLLLIGFFDDRILKLLSLF